jgi:hypothetical protein
MKNICPALVLGLFAPLYAADEAATDYWVRAMPLAWMATFDGSSSYSAAGNQGDTKQLNDLGLAGDEIGFGLEAGAKLPILVSLHVGGFQQETSGSFTTSSFAFAGQNFTSGTSELSLTDGYIEADFRPLDLDIAGVAIGLGYHVMSTEMTVSGGGNSVGFNEDIQFPVVALRGHVNVPFLLSLGAEAKIHWMEGSYGGHKISFVDAALQITYMPWNLFGVMAGVRYLNSDVEFRDPLGSNSEAVLDLTLMGPFVGVIGKF